MVVLETILTNITLYTIKQTFWQLPDQIDLGKQIQMFSNFSTDKIGTLVIH